MYVLAPNQTVQTYPYTIEQLQEDNPDDNLVPPISTDVLAGYNVFSVTEVSQPDYDYFTQVVTEVNPTLDNGEWVQTWQVGAASSERIQLLRDEAAMSIRITRNDILRGNDWTQLQDSPVDSTPWATYRQELRDITTQVGFPTHVTWPTPPS